MNGHFSDVLIDARSHFYSEHLRSCRIHPFMNDQSATARRDAMEDATATCTNAILAEARRAGVRAHVIYVWDGPSPMIKSLEAAQRLRQRDLAQARYDRLLARINAIKERPVSSTMNRTPKAKLRRLMASMAHWAAKVIPFPSVNAVPENSYLLFSQSHSCNPGSTHILARDEADLCLQRLVRSLAPVPPSQVVVVSDDGDMAFSEGPSRFKHLVYHSRRSRLWSALDKLALQCHSKWPWKTDEALRLAGLASGQDYTGGGLKGFGLQRLASTKLIKVSSFVHIFYHDPLAYDC